MGKLLTQCAFWARMEFYYVQESMEKMCLPLITFFGKMEKYF